jgi:hypothetical protein
MAERRMFAKTIVTSDAFLDMPLSARCLYFTLGMLADDDGFVNNPKSIMRQVGASQDDLNLLLAKRFILAFDSGVIVIKHWRIHNYIQKDRYKESKYIEEKASLMIDEKGAYTECIQDVYKVDTQVRLGKASLGKASVVEGSSGDSATTTATATEENQLKLIGADLGKNVVYLTDRQLGDLMDRLGLDAFNRYVERLANFIIENNAHIKCHYKMILKWWEEDTKVSNKPKAQPEKARYGNFDVNVAVKKAMERTYGTEGEEI